MKKLGIFKYEYVGERAIQSGFTELDKITFGWKKGELIVIGGRPAMGKTALAISLVRNIAILNRTPIVYFSLEMSTVQFMNRFLSNVQQIILDAIFIPVNALNLTDFNLRSAVIVTEYNFSTGLVFFILFCQFIVPYFENDLG